MGLLVPEDLPLDRLVRSETRVVQSLISGLKDSWLIVPRLDFVTKRRPYEIDVLLVNEHHGILALEVKGGPFEIRNGEWYRRGEIVSPSPPQQAHAAAYNLRDLLRNSSPALRKVHVQHAVALPDLTGLAGKLPPDIGRNHLLLTGDLLEPQDPTRALMSFYPANRPLNAEQINEVLRIVRPDLEFDWNPQAEAIHARAALRRISAEQTRALATLDLNQRVVVSGPAGSGKTRLVLSWAHRALHRGERTLLTCFNEPIAEWLDEMTPENELLTVGPFQKTLMALEGLPPLSPPVGADEQWWSTEPFRHLEEHLDQVSDRFDTIIIDEAQDFSPTWFHSAECLLRPNGPGRILMVADPEQSLYGRGYELPSADSNLVRASLRVNCRNTHAVADMLRQFGGAPAAPSAPEGRPVRLVECSKDDEAVSAVGTLLEELVVTLHVNPANILVCTGHTSLRDMIRANSPAGFSCGSWEDRHNGEIICETIHRTKGLERDAVILVSTDADLNDHLLYVGMSRAVSVLAIVAPPQIVKRLGSSSGQ